VDDATRALFAAVRALSPTGFEELVRLLPAQWDAMLRMEGIDTSQSGFGVLLKARWQNFPRAVRRRFAQDMGMAARRVSQGPEPDPRVVNLAGASRAVSGQEAVGQAPRDLAKRVRAAAKSATTAAESLTTAAKDGRMPPEDALSTLAEFGDLLAAARDVLAERGVSPVPERAGEVASLLDEVASGGDRELLRAAVSSLAAVEDDLPLLASAGSKARELSAVPANDWSNPQVKLARGLAAVVELRRLAGAGGKPEDLLEVSSRAQSLLPADLQGLAILAASGGFNLPEAPPKNEPASGPAPKRRGRKRSNAAVA
jgi:hypothetical protein